MFEGAEQALARKATLALAHARQRRKLFARFKLSFGDPAWEILLGLTQLSTPERGVDLAKLAASLDMPELDMRRHLAGLCEAELAWMRPPSATNIAQEAGISAAGLSRVRAALARKSNWRMPEPPSV